MGHREGYLLLVLRPGKADSSQEEKVLIRLKTAQSFGQCSSRNSRRRPRPPGLHLADNAWTSVTAICQLPWGLEQPDS